MVRLVKKVKRIDITANKIEINRAECLKPTQFQPLKSILLTSTMAMKNGKK